MNSLLLYLLTLGIAPLPLTSLEVSICNVSNPKGSLHLAIYDDPADFEQQKAAIFDQIIPVTSTREVRLMVPFMANQAHAIAVYHDLNDNGKLDTNAFGIPKEPYAFSNNPSAKWQKPSFLEIAFRPQQVMHTGIRLELKRWEER
ncbi:MAG: hypothetical protein DA408_13820 [Bacteroidetes bacterium]|nr:MAG: hypothetical protein C7N36_05885 [Bacteroidota bacterium]PTM11308.1 MAG: hypothetical protein DA408_13820 [Bacteroidota bacterium]